MKKTAIAAVLMLGILGIGLALWPREIPAPEIALLPPPRPAPGLELVHPVTRDTFKVGEPVLIQFELRNSGTTPLLVVRPLDGSDVGMRAPRSIMSLRDENGPVPPPGRLRCGNVNPLEPADFVKLLPGQSLPVAAHALGREKAGTYELTFTYDAAAQDPRQWFGFCNPPEGRALELLRDAARVRLESTVRFKVEP